MGMAQGAGLLRGHDHHRTAPPTKSLEHATMVLSMSRPYYLLGWSTVAPEPVDPQGPGAVDWDAVLAQLADQPDEAGWVTLDEAAAAAAGHRWSIRSPDPADPR